MLLLDFIDMAVTEFEYCYINNCEQNRIVYKGTLKNIPDTYKNKLVTSWEITNGIICFNIS